MMMRTVAVVRPYLAAAFVIGIGLIGYGCGDTATVSQPAELGNLSVSTGTLQPRFNPATTSYSVQLSSDVSSTTITASPRVAGDSIRIDNQTTTSQTVTLDSPGDSKTVSIVVTDSGAGGGSQSYTVRLTRAGLAGNNSLQSLAVSSGALAPTFDANIQDYTVDVANNISSITVTPTLSDPAATMTVNSQATNSGQARTITLNPAGQPTNIPIVVTAQNGTPKTYEVTVSRGVSGNNNLSGLSVSSGTLNPSFTATRTSYTVNVASTVNSVTVTPRLQDTTATMTVNGQGTNSGQGRASTLNGAGSNTLINIVVTAQNNTQKTYIVNISRAALGGNNNLSGLTVSPGSLDPDFDEDTTSYSVSVGSGVSNITVTPTRQNSTATITMNGTLATSGQGRSITLNGAGSNTLINVVVTAQNGTQKTYSVNVSRAALGGNNNLSALNVSPGPLSPAFTAARTTYTVSAGSGVDSISVTATKADSNASMTINNQVTNSGQQRTINLGAPGSSTEIDISVTAPNGTPRTYTVTVNRANLGGNNNLSSLTVSPGTLTPAFTASRTSYSVNVGSSVNNLAVTANKADSNASMTINNQGTNSGQQRTIGLEAPGNSTEIDIIVTAPNGDPKIYTIVVNRPLPSSNNNLSALSVTPGSLSPTFDEDILGYNVNVGSNVTSVAVSATKADPNAVISGDVPNNGQTNITLSGAGTTTSVSIIVTAPNGISKTYSIDIIRAAPATPPAKPAAPDLISADDSCLLKFGLPVVTGTNDDCEPVTIATSNRNDNFTNVTTPRFAIPQPGQGLTPNLYVDGNKVASTFNAGNSTLQPTTPLTADGDGIQHSITSTVTDTATNLESEQSDGLTVTISTPQSGT